MSSFQTERVPITKYIQAETGNHLSESKNENLHLIVS